eukprot:11047797-Alexandrium_andersonii.AAC.1
MSASLVGSEMCIRDRHRSMVPSPPNPRPSAACSAVPSAAALGPSVVPSCLLYTSDAADDM